MDSQPESCVDLKTRDAARRFYGSRLKANEHPQKVRARAMGISPQGISRHERGEVDSISCDQMRGLSRLDLTVALGVVNGFRVICESEALSGLSLADLLEVMPDAMRDEQEPDGAEDRAQYELAEILGVVAFMQESLSPFLRRELTLRLDRWMERTLAHADAALAAVAKARALRTKLAPVVED